MWLALLGLTGCGGPNATDNPSDRTGDERAGAGPSDASDWAGSGRVPVIQSREAMLGQVQRLTAAGGLIEAQRLMRDLLVRFPEDPEVTWVAAQLLSAQGNVDEAVAMLDAAAENTPEQESGWQMRAALLMAGAQRWQEAIDRLTTLVDRNPDLDEARHQLADLLNLRGYRFDANEQVRELCRRGGATPAQLLGLVVPSASHAGLSQKPNIEDPESIEKLGPMNVARALMSEGEIGDAAKVLSRSQPLADRHPAAIALYGQLLWQSQQFDAFDRWRPTAGPACQRYPAFWMAVGGWAMRERDFNTAVRMFAEAILREPGDIMACDRIVQALAASGHPRESERMRQRGVTIDTLVQKTKSVLLSSNPPLDEINEISQLLNQIGRPAESLAWFRIALERMGSPESAMRQLDQALAHLDRADFQTTTQATRMCGIDLTTFPLDLSGLAVDQAPKRSPTPVTAQPSTPPLEPAFANIARDVGLDFRYRNATTPVEREFLIFQQIGGGVGCFDYDLNGRVDFYIAQAAGDPPNGLGNLPNVLFRNHGEAFVAVTELAGCDDRGFSGGVTCGDWNQDGLPDLVVANIQRNSLFINQGDGTFRRESADAVWNDPAYTTSVAIADISGDHLPDIIEINYLDDPRIYDPIEHDSDGSPLNLPAPNQFQSAVDRVFVSKGDSSLVGSVVGDPEHPLPGTGLGVVVTDVDGAPGNEIFVANDHLANHLWEPSSPSDSNQPWQETAALRGVALGTNGMPLGCMGIAVADFDENGRVDLHVTNFEKQWSNHFMQTSPGVFEDLVVAFGLAQPTLEMVGFGTQAIDYDNNSVIDLVIGNGHVEDMTPRGGDFEMPTQMFTIRDSRFESIRVTGDDEYWNADHLTRAVAYCDWNRDGRVDFVATDLQEPFALLENRTETTSHWLQLQLVGTRCERDAVGATVRVTIGPRTVTKVVQAGDGYMCKNESVLCYGLADHTSVDRVEILWPDGEQQVLSELAADERWQIVQGDPEPFSLDG